MSKKLSKLEKKYAILTNRLKEENPEIHKEFNDFLDEIGETWKRISPFVGEEQAYAKLDLVLNDDYEIRGLPLDFILWFVLFKRMFGKLDKELEWFKKNKEILEMMVKEYSEAQKLR